MVKLKIKRLDYYAIIPKRAYKGDSGMDLYSLRDYKIPPGGRQLISTGIAVEIPEGYEMQIRPRSGLALNHGVTVINTPGTIDSSYRGEIKVVLINHGEKVFEIKKGHRIAQEIISRVEKVEIEEVGELEKSVRGEDSFGSSGIV